MCLLLWLLYTCALIQKFQAVSAAYTRLVASEETDDTISTVSLTVKESEVATGLPTTGTNWKYISFLCLYRVQLRLVATVL